MIRDILFIKVFKYFIVALAMDLTPYFLRGIEGDERFAEAVGIVRQNTRGGNIWAIGGIVFRKIFYQLYGIGSDSKDFDFLIENPAPWVELRLPLGWTLSQTSMGSPKLKRGDFRIDFIPLDNAVAIQDKERLERMSVEEKLVSYFSKAPLNIQAIAYDFDNERVIVEEGIRAILEKRLKINCLQELLEYCKRKDITIEEYVRRRNIASALQVII